MKEFKGLYVHAPFCRSKCLYCDFYSGLKLKSEKEFKRAVLKELSLRAPHFSQFPTIYFGGGTPSLLSPSFFEAILSKVGQFSEITVEFNPEDAKEEKLRALKELGVNRISIGVQSLSEKSLKLLKRKHSVKESLKAVETALKYFPNTSVDLMFGIPQERPEEFLKGLDRITEFPIKHLSLYALTLYEETELKELVESGKLKMPNEKTFKREYYEARELLKEKGFNQYEISNFAVKGFESKHNLLYWKMENYLGIGPSAASLLENLYWKNLSDYGKYLKAVERGKLPTEKVEELSEKELTELKIAMGLRLTEGIDLKLIPERVRENERFKSLLEEELIEVREKKLRLKERALLISNWVISEILTPV
ncbi:radical SAM family heme chaperone HemW [Thermovibrio sp.]